MNVIENFHFVRPYWLLLLPIAALLWWRRRQLQDPLRGWRRVMDARLLNALTVGDGTVGHWRERGLLLGWLLAVIAVAGPTWRPEPSPFADDPIPVMVLLRAGESMDLEDMLPSRMERARLKVTDLAAARKGQPMGLIAYAGSAHLVLPPTRDTAVVASMAEEISPDIMPKLGDDLAAALRLADRTLGEGRGSVVVVADDATTAEAESLERFRTEAGLPVSILAVARDGTPEMDHLREASRELGGKLTALTPDATDVEAIVRQTANAPVPVAVAGAGQRWAEMGWWIVPVIALLSLSVFRRVQQINPEEVEL
ncbi:MAG: vWA domain-containing protein [Rubripirellula sp.]